jgi:hypothetical protein
MPTTHLVPLYPKLVLDRSTSSCSVVRHPPFPACAIERLDPLSWPLYTTRIPHPYHSLSTLCGGSFLRQSHVITETNGVKQVQRAYPFNSTTAVTSSFFFSSSFSPSTSSFSSFERDSRNNTSERKKRRDSSHSSRPLRVSHHQKRSSVATTSPAHRTLRRHTPTTVVCTIVRILLLSPIILQHAEIGRLRVVDSSLHSGVVLYKEQASHPSSRTIDRNDLLAITADSCDVAKYISSGLSASSTQSSTTLPVDKTVADDSQLGLPWSCGNKLFALINWTVDWQALSRLNNEREMDDNCMGVSRCKAETWSEMARQDCVIGHGCIRAQPVHLLHTNLHRTSYQMRLLPPTALTSFTSIDALEGVTRHTNMHSLSTAATLRPGEHNECG